MPADATKDLVRRYYEAWAARDRDEVRRLLDDHLMFRSPQDTFDSADSFLSACWKYSTGLTGVRFESEVYENDRAFVILEWLSEDGGHFVDAEYAQVGGGKIRAIVVVNNDPSFEKLIR